jgi:hypothetical protein
VLRRLDLLDGFGAAEKLDYAEQLSDLADAQSDAPLSPDDRRALIASLPLVDRVELHQPTRPDLRFQTVKSLARLAAEPGGIESYVRLQDLPASCANPPAPHIASFAEAIPVRPNRLRKAVLAALEARFQVKARKVSSEMEQLTAMLSRGRMVMNLSFAGKGRGAMSHQMDYSLWADLDGVRMEPTSYEAIWLLPAQWDLLTPTNLAASAEHLVNRVETRLALEGS